MTFAESGRSRAGKNDNAPLLKSRRYNGRSRGWIPLCTRGFALVMASGSPSHGFRLSFPGTGYAKPKTSKTIPLLGWMVLCIV